jgi:general secretion pathway protein F
MTASDPVTRSLARSAGNTRAFSYRAARLDGTMHSGLVEATSADDAAARLLALGLHPTHVAPRPVAHARPPVLPAADVALGLRLLGDLLAAGLPMSRALAAFETLAPRSWHAALPIIRDAIREGRGLASALASASAGMPSIVIGIIGAGEAGSGIADAVRQAADVMEETAVARAALRNALAYPLTLAVAGAGSVALLVGVVLPRFEAILRDLGQQLPPSTRLLVQSAAIARVSALPALAVGALLALAFRAWTSSSEGRLRWHDILLGVPLIGTLRMASATARCCAALAALLKSGVPIASALVHAGRAAGDSALEARMHVAREATVHGTRLSTALADVRAVTETAIRLVRAGEETGRLSEMLAHAARIERARATQLTRSAVRVIEPSLILLFGGLVALVAAALLQAIYSVRPAT